VLKLAVSQKCVVLGQYWDLGTGVDGLESMQSLLELVRKTIVGLGLIGEKRVSTSAGTVENIEERCPWRLLLVGHV